MTTHAHDVVTLLRSDQAYEKLMQGLVDHPRREIICGALAHIGDVLDPRKRDLATLTRQETTAAATYLRLALAELGTV